MKGACDPKCQETSLEYDIKERYTEAVGHIHVCDACVAPCDDPRGEEALVLPVVDLDETMEEDDQITDGDVIVLEIRRIMMNRVFKQQPEYLVEWTGLDVSFNMWIHKDVLEQDVPNMVQTYDTGGPWV